MYAAKARGKGRYEVYKPALQKAMVERLERTADLQRAVDEQEFVVHYQPIVSLDRPRDHHRGRGAGPMASPRTRAPAAEGVHPACRRDRPHRPARTMGTSRSVSQARQWQLNHKPCDTFHISVNISARHFQHDGLVEDVSEALRAGGLDPSSLVLEITESVLVQDADSVIARMLELKLLGVAFAIDDFGTGYSSLSYLKRFPIDILKVDKSFVDDVGESAGKRRTCRSHRPTRQHLASANGRPKASSRLTRWTSFAPWAASTGRASTSPSRSGSTRSTSC